MSQSRSKMYSYMFILCHENESRRRRGRKKPTRELWTERMVEKYDDFIQYMYKLMIALRFNWRKLNRLFRQIDMFHSRTSSSKQFFSLLSVSFYFLSSFSIYSSAIESDTKRSENWLRKLSRAPLIRWLHLICVVMQTAIGYYSVFFHFDYFIKYSKQ